VRRLFWLVMGITIGALIVRKLSTMAQKLTPSGMAAGVASALSDISDSLREFSTDVREAMSQRETELRSGTGMDGELGKKPQ